jgi:hypothetical protein
MITATTMVVTLAILFGAVVAAGAQLVSVPLDATFENEGLYINVSLNGVAVAVLLDSGSSTLAVPLPDTLCTQGCRPTCSAAPGTLTSWE